MKGIILAGGAGSRLYPLTQIVSKQLQPVYDKPMVYYPLTTLIEAGIKDICLISTPHDTPHFHKLLGSGSQWGISIIYKTQTEPKGIAEAFIIAADFIASDEVTLILGDNIFSSGDYLKRVVSSKKVKGAHIFAYPVHDPSRYGIVEINEFDQVTSLKEKPRKPKSNLAVPGLYVYDNKVVSIAQKLKPSARGELEITDVNIEFMKKDKLNVEIFGRGMAWFDTGTHSGLLEASNFIETIQKRQGLYIACLEEIAYNKKFITKDQLINIGNMMNKTDYGQYILNLK